ncbi:hypothetical protein CCP3SC1_680015 [Gammaproteobacteria bacterium]
MDEDLVAMVQDELEITKDSGRGTDEAFHQLMTLCGMALLRLLGLNRDETEHYHFRATVLKSKQIRPDLEAIPLWQRGQRVFIEFQAYSDPWIRYRLVSAIILSCQAEEYPGPVLGAIVFSRH